MAFKLTQVDHDPFAQSSSGGYKLTQVEGDPFAADGFKDPGMMPSHSPELKASHESTAPQPSVIDRTLRQSARVISPVARPVLEYGGMAAGAAAGAVAGVPGGPAGVATGGVLGGGGGYALGKQGADWLDVYAGEKEPPKDAGEAYKEAAKDVATGSMYEMGGRIAAPIIGGVVKGVGAVAKPLLGKMSGVGKGAVEEALKSGSSFDKALRGKITGDEIVDNAKTALGALKDQRATAYQAQLSKITQSGKQIDVAPVISDLTRLMRKYNVRVSPSGELDISRIAMGKTGRNDIKEIVETISSWGSKPGDKTAEGLDVLKRQLDDFWSDSSQARQFVSSIRNSVKRTISKEVPEYETMVKGYQEATKLIKDIESGLMMRKQGISGRIVADQTLRRLMSSMKDNYTLRKELVEVLGNQGGSDLAGQIAGFTMRSPIPIGLAGTGPAIAAEAAYTMINPSFWPVLAASSPRVQGEFLRVFGRGLKAASKVPKRAVGEGVKQILINSDGE